MANIIENDPLVAAIMEHAAKLEGKPEAKFKALIRAGKIAEAYGTGYNENWESVHVTFGGTRSLPREQQTCTQLSDQLQNGQANIEDKLLYSIPPQTCQVP